MKLNGKQIAIIAANPLQHDLAPVRALLEACAEAPTRDVVERTLATLALSTAALDLAETEGLRRIGYYLTTVRQLVHEGTIHVSQCRPLLDRVYDGSTDYVIWQTAGELVKALVPRPLPLSKYKAMFRYTPIMTGSDDNACSQTRADDEAGLLRTFRNNTFRNVGGFCNKFFAQQSCQTQYLDKLLTRHDGHRWVGFPSDPDQDSVHRWITTLQHDFLNETPNRVMESSSTYCDRSEDIQKDLFFLHPSADPCHSPSYGDVLVVGVLKGARSSSDFENNFVKLAWHVRCVFTDQPLRLFVHAFVLCGPTIEFWVFDRSGPFSSGAFNVHDEPRRFSRALIAYATMQDSDMGLNHHVKRDGPHHCITLDKTAETERTKTFKLNKAMVRKKAIVSRATTVYGTEEGHVAKFAWLTDQEAYEADLLRLAECSEVKGVPKLVAFRQLTTTAELREGLHFPMAYKFRDHDIYAVESLLTSAYTSISRKRSLSPQSSTSHPNKHQKTSATTSSREASTGPTSPGQSADIKTRQWENKVYACFVMSPAGRVINDFESIQEMLEAMTDAIKAHRSLHDKAGILHQDISPNNIIITEPGQAQGLKGMLIDLDVARRLGRDTQERRGATGTLPYMAVNVLLCDEEHSYRHDLESFFYVLLWLCARQAWQNGLGDPSHSPRTSRIDLWEVGPLETIVCRKAYDMTHSRLEEIMNDFPKAFDVVKPLCLQLKTILFGDTFDLRFGTPNGDPGDLYDAVIQAFEGIIEQHFPESDATS